MYVGKFQNQSGIICKIVSAKFAESLSEPSGKPVAHPYGDCLAVFSVPPEWEREAEWRAKSGWLNDRCIWEWNGVGMLV